jgi:hypothetical protein
MVSTPTGDAKVVSLNTLRQTVVLQFVESMTYHELSVDELKLQYGLTVRPLDVQAAVEGPIREAEAAAPAPVSATATLEAALESVNAVQALLAPAAPAPAAPEAVPAERRSKRRRRRRKGRGGSGGAADPSAGA